jgi:mitogen-activated protein kinase 1/3
LVPSLRPLGHGAYGVVVSATDRVTGQKVAIKKCPNIFEDPLDAKRIAREIRLLRHFNHPNIIKILDITPPTAADFNDVYIVAELMDTDLHRVIYSGQRLTEEHIQFFLYQLLCGIKYMHSANVIHRDLKPSNILLNENCDLKVCDFGLSRDMNAATGADLPANLTEYVVTRWYRAPEIMLSSQEYSKGIDMWAIGCIFGEMLGRKPMFPGNDYIHQLKLITKVIGTPTSEADLWFVRNPKAKLFMLGLPPTPPQDLRVKFPDASLEAIDLLQRMLQLDYQKRIRVEDALEHPYFTAVRDPNMECIAQQSVSLSEIEATELTRANLQMVILEDICAVRPEALPLLAEHQMRAGGMSAGAAPAMMMMGGDMTIMDAFGGM